MDGHAAVIPLLSAQLQLLARQTLPQIRFRILALHFLKENIPHLIVAAQVLDLMYQFVFDGYSSSSNFSSCQIPSIS